jgi:hypothetical protein
MTITGGPAYYEIQEHVGNKRFDVMPPIARLRLMLEVITVIKNGTAGVMKSIPARDALVAQLPGSRRTDNAKTTRVAAATTTSAGGAGAPVGGAGAASDDAPVAATTTTRSCTSYGTKRGCRFGKECWYVHSDEVAAVNKRREESEGSGSGGFGRGRGRDRGRGRGGGGGRGGDGGGRSNDWHDEPHSHPGATGREERHDLPPRRTG